MSWQKLSVIVGVLIGIVTLVGVGFKVDAFYARADEVRGFATKLEYTNKRLEQKIKQDSLYNLKKRSWAIEDRLATKGKDLALQREKREIDHQVQILEDELSPKLMATE
jgi:hypothetical protein